MKTTDVRVRRAITAMAAGRPVVLSDGADDDGQLVFAADAATPSLLHFAIRHTSGYVRVALPGKECARLNLPPISHTAEDVVSHCVSVDAFGTGTGISAADRARTIAALASSATVASDLQRPGHVVPVRVEADGVLSRRRPAEAATDLAFLAGRGRCAGFSEIVSRRDPALLAGGHEAVEFAVAHGLAVVSIAELVEYRRRTEPQVVRLTETVLPTRAGNCRAIGYRDVHDGGEHLALIVGTAGAGIPLPLHVHVECLTGDVFGSNACRCGDELDRALARMSGQAGGVVLYLRPSGPPRACGLFAPPDASPHGNISGTVTWILRDLGVFALELSDETPGFGLVMFGAIREQGIGTQTLAVAG
ncbi:3,4-dihydroxy-2-butanone-4-phosphate synthase [Mycobacterium asiaticum]|uniref:3,4-dihydroxy-2-butanone-4-phosphate synthase n=1 Tax=Mycobacterium asiaticum TaxID=1790 RepID=UPI0005654E3A|nr:3,4-dihydroxy-2-butanone-4-phosphate synthase [Mycobacterium asiaticum]ORA12953.1 riboflavin biosynthesis protein RibA [Mycobacterium asiaticum DSM 44297]